MCAQPLICLLINLLHLPKLRLQLFHHIVWIHAFFFAKVSCHLFNSFGISLLHHLHSVPSHWILHDLAVVHYLLNELLWISHHLHHLHWIHSSSAPFFALEDVVFDVEIAMDFSITSLTPFISSLKALTSSFKTLKSICGIFVDCSVFWSKIGL